MGGHGVRKYNADSFLCARFCEQSASCKANDVQILRYCNLDTMMHPTGYWREKVWTAGTEMNRKYVSYHANYVKTREAKIDLLSKADLWGFWNMSIQRCRK